MTHRIPPLIAASFAAVLLVAACGEDGTETVTVDSAADEAVEVVEAQSPAEDSTTTEVEPSVVTVTDATGTEVTVPVTDGGIFALDEIAAAQLLALGVAPEATGTWFRDLAAQAVAEDAGTELLDFSGDAPPLEDISARGTQLVVGIGHPFSLQNAPQLRAVAPTLVLDFTAPWKEQLRTLAQVTGRTDEAEQLIDRVDERTAELAGTVAGTDRAGQSVSIIGNRAGNPVAMAANSLAGQLLSELGFTRPAAQDAQGQGPYPAIQFSAEQLGQHDADIVVELTGAVFGPEKLTDSPLIDTSDSLVVEVFGQPWASSSPLAAWTVLTDIDRVVVDGEDPTAADDAVALFAELTATGGTA